MDPLLDSVEFVEPWTAPGCPKMVGWGQVVGFWVVVGGVGKTFVSIG